MAKGSQMVVSTSFTSFRDTRQLSQFWRSPKRALLLATAFLVVWNIWAATFNTAQFGDNVEQFNWAQSLELGYHKHPPLPSWLLGLLVRVVGSSVYWAFFLASACLIGAMTFTWSLGSKLIGTTASSAAVLLWGLNMTLAQRAQLYNHNTVLVLFVAATAWCAWRASENQYRNITWWVLTGVSAAGAILSKYQAFVPLAGIGLALVRSGRLATPCRRTGLVTAVVILLVLCMPHAVWIVKHDYSTLRYASESISHSDLVQRLGFVVSFVANQARLWSPAFVALLLLLVANHFFPLPVPETAPAALDPGLSSLLDAWMFGLLWFGLAVLGALALFFGVNLRNHWGAQSLQFFGLWIVWKWHRHASIDLARLAWAVLLVHLLNMAWYAFEHLRPISMVSERRMDTKYPAQLLADAATTHWRSRTQCPMTYVAGTAFDAGLVSLYSGGHLRVFDSEAATPWITPEQLRIRGALYVLVAGDTVPEGVVDLIDFIPFPKAGPNPRSNLIRIGLRYPAASCER